MKALKYALALIVLLLPPMGSIAYAGTFTGSVSNGTPVEYIVPTNDGDILQLLVTSTNPAMGQLTSLSLFTPVFNLVGTATGNQLDMFSSGFQFNTTGLGSGNWIVEVIDPVPGSYDYSLTITGNSGRMPFLATTSEPSAVELLFIGLLGPAGLALRRRRLA